MSTGNIPPLFSAYVPLCRYDEDAALTFGKAVSGMFAHAKGKSIGVIESKAKDPEVRAG